MSTSKRFRNQYPFVVDDQTVTNLGADGLTELAANLWPIDCQTCGDQLGPSRPTVHVTDFTTHILASAHHARCRPARWATNSVISPQQVLTYHTRCFLFTSESDSRDDRPLILVNPSLERAVLSFHDGYWTASTVPTYRRLGLRNHYRDLDAVVPDIIARLDGNELTVTIPDSGDTWNHAHADPITQRVRELGGVTLAITTAADPHQLHSVQHQFRTLMKSGQVAIGWVALASAEALRQLHESGAPDFVTTYLLHYGRHHATVGELLATTDWSLPLAQAQTWALSQINLTEERLLPWDQPPDDPNAWYVLDAISFQHYFLRRHTDAWKLIKVISYVDGRGPTDEAEAQEWAAKHVRNQDNTRIITWIPGPSTGPEFATFHGVGVPS